MTTEARTRVYRAAALLTVLALMAMIFWFSAQPASASRQSSGRLVLALEKLFRAYTAKLSTLERFRWRASCTKVVRKLAHAAEFAALGAAIAVWLELVRRRRSDRRTLGFAWLAATLYGVTDEVHQMFVPGRGPGALDVLIDSAGALIGAAAVLLLLRAVRRRRQKTEKP